MLELAHVSKRFGSFVALDDVSLAFAPGEIHALLGENGAGKTTLMNILYGLLRPDSGVIRLNGRPLRFARPADAQAVGIGMVHQHFMLVERFSVAENIALGGRAGGFWLSPAAARRRVRETAERFGLPVDPGRAVEELSVGERQRVEILKALIHDVGTLILDEPTAVLTPGEVETLFASLRRLRANGCRVIFISHKLSEVVSLADRVTVLRRGRCVCSEPIGALTPADLAERMVGARLPPGDERPGGVPGGVVLELDGVQAGSGRVALRDLHLAVRAGEIVGVAGVDGNGQAELTRLVLGIDAPGGGRLAFRGAATAEASPDRGEWRRIAHIADDRQREALAPAMSLADNAVLKSLDQPRFSRCGWLRRGAIRAHLAGLIREYDIRAPSPGAPASALSGGNQQKLVVARELDGGPALIVAVNPTRGLDVAATDFVHRRLRERRAAGAAVLLVSADLDEILALADRVVVLFGGRLTPAPTVRGGDAIDVAALGRLMAGLPLESEPAA